MAAILPVPASAGQARGLAFAVLFGLTAFLGWYAAGPGRNAPPCESVCRRCDSAIWQALEHKLAEPRLFTRDRIFALQYPLFPRPFGHAMNFLARLTGRYTTAQSVAFWILGAAFLAGLFLLNQAVGRSWTATAVAALLAALVARGGPSWSWPHLKPSEVVGAFSGLALYLLFRGLRERGLVELFALLAVGLVYVHPPSGLVLLGLGALTYLTVARRESRFREGALGAGAISLLGLLPLVLAHGDSVVQAGPSIRVLLARADYSFFPTKATILLAMAQLVAPVAVALWLLPVARRHLPDLNGRFLVTVGTLALLLGVASGLTYAWTSLGRYTLWGATRYAYFPAFLVIALAVAHRAELPPRRRLLVMLAALALAAGLDNRGVQFIQSLRHPPGAAADRAPAEAAPERPERATPNCDLAEAATWAQQHTDRDALFMVPPQDVDAGFRVLSHRALVVADKDGGNSKYDTYVAHEWDERMAVVTAAYRDGSRAALRAAARRYEAQYVLEAARPGLNTADADFLNTRWVIWSTGLPVPGGAMVEAGVP